MVRCDGAGRTDAMKSDEFVPPAADGMSTGVEVPRARTPAAMLSECSGSRQFGAAFLAEGAQRIYRVAVHWRS